MYEQADNNTVLFKQFLSNEAEVIIMFAASHIWICGIGISSNPLCPIFNSEAGFGLLGHGRLDKHTPPTLRDNLLVLSERQKQFLCCWTKKIKSKVCLETSIRNYQPKPCNVSKEWKSELHQSLNYTKALNMPSVDLSNSFNKDNHTDTPVCVLIAQGWIWWHERNCHLCRVVSYVWGSAFSCTGINLSAPEFF
jgi:hypothetical protein